MKPLAKFLLKASFAGTFAETMLVPLYAILTQRFHGDVLDAGIGYGIFSITTGVFVALVGQTDWFERNTKSMVFWGFLVAGICDLLYLAVQNTIEFFAVQVLLGLAIGMLNPAWDALYSEDDDENVSQAKKWSFWTGGINFVTGVSALLGAVIVSTIGFQWLFVIMAACDTLAIYYSWRVWRLVPETEIGKDTTCIAGHYLAEK